MKPALFHAFATKDIDNIIAASTPGGIQNQERHGQSSFVANNTLPIECPRKELEKMGVVFGENADDLFVNVQLPIGWKKKPTDHYLYTDLIDNNDKKVASIFYKAAFYDRRAWCYLTKE